MQLPLAFYRFVFGRQPAGFLYHIVSERPVPHVRHLYPFKTPRMFEADLIYLKENFRLISYEDLLSSRSGGKRLEARSALLSFDDGMEECFSIARPLLLKHQIPCTFFIPTDVIDNHKMLYRHRVSLCIEKASLANAEARGHAFAAFESVYGKGIESLDEFIKWIKSFSYFEQDQIDAICRSLEVDIADYLQNRHPYLSVDQVRSLASDGFTIGAHTRGHPRLRLLNRDEIEEEILASCQIVARIVQKEQVPFALPFNSNGLDGNLIEEICKRNPSVGLVFDARGVRQTDRLFNRIMVDRPINTNGGSDLPRHLQRAYNEAYSWWKR